VNVKVQQEGNKAGSRRLCIGNSNVLCCPLVSNWNIRRRG